MKAKKKFGAGILGLSIALALSSNLNFTPPENQSPVFTAAYAADNQISERKITLVGNLQKKVGAAKDWEPAEDKTLMNSLGNGFYSLTLDLPAGTYYYKIAINGSWSENYGLDGNRDGANVQLNLKTPQKVTFYYNDITHKIRDSTNYKMLADSELPRLEGVNVEGGDNFLRDLMLDNFFQKELNMQAGTYRVSLTQGGKTIAERQIDIANDGKISFYYDAAAKNFFIDDGRIQENKIFHDTWDAKYRSPFEAVKTGESVKISVATRHGDAQNVKLVLGKAKITAGDGGDEYNPTFPATNAKNFSMRLERTDNEQDIWSMTLRLDEAGIYGYKFLINDAKEYGDDAQPGHVGEVKIHAAKPFQLTVYRADFHTPDWAKEAVLYQIFPDRFFNGDTTNDNARQFARGYQPIQHRAWNELPANHSKTPDLDGDNQDCNDFFGGDLAGITQKLDYLQSLGVTAIYLNPIMNACSNHRYDTVDYGTIDPILGTQQDFQTLSAEIKRRGMHLIMDGVFNHVGDDSIYFDRYSKYKSVGAYEYWSRVYNLMSDKNLSEAAAKTTARQQLTAEGQEFSPYQWENWFDIRNEKTSDDMGDKYAYHDWQGYSSLTPFRDSDFLSKNSTLRKYLLDDKDAVITKWFDYGLSGWRMDVAKEVPPDFWTQVRRKIKKIRVGDQEPLLIAEIWQDGSQFLTGDQFDSVMNYKLAFAVNDLFIMNGNAQAADEELKTLRQNYPREAFYTLMNFVDSHDTARAIYKFGGGNESIAQATHNDFNYDLGKARLKLAMTFIAGYPGMPTIFYGDEAGIFGSADPDCRRTYPWNAEDADLLDYYKKIMNIRNANKKLFAHGELITLKATGDIYSYLRGNDSEAAVVILNRGAAQHIEIDAPQLPNGMKFIDKLSGKEIVVSNGKISVDAGEHQAFIFIRSAA